MSEYQVLYCNDCSTQPLQYRVNERGKYEIVIFEIRGMGLLSEDCKPYLEDEFDDLIFGDDQWSENCTYVCLRKGNLWGLYKYWWSEENEEKGEHSLLLGCVFEQVEDFKWERLKEMLDKHGLEIYFNRNIISFGDDTIAADVDIDINDVDW